MVCAQIVAHLSIKKMLIFCATNCEVGYYHVSGSSIILCMQNQFTTLFIYFVDKAS